MILCLGTTPALARTMQFDGLTLDAVNRAADVYEYASGKAVNAARVVATIGANTTVLGPQGGATGQRLAQSVADIENVTSRLVPVATPTRLCVTVIDRLCRTTTELIENGGPLTEAEVRQIEATFYEALAGARFAVLTGSLAAGVPEGFYRGCVEACQRAGVPVLLDAVGTPLMAAFPARPTVVKLNADELGRSTNRPTASEAEVCQAARDAALQTGGWVIVTRGRAATVAVHARDGAFRVEVPAVHVISAIGSGDSFAAGLAVALTRGETVPEALKQATACASANAMTPHAGHVRAQDVASLLARVHVESIA